MKEEINSEYISDLNNTIHFDICLMNPPYATTGGGTIHLQFVDKLLDLADEQVVIMPFRFVTNIYNKQNNKFKDRFSKYLISAEQYRNDFDINLKSDTGLGIYHYKDNKEEDIKISFIDNKSLTIKNLNDYSLYSDYEKEIISYLGSRGSNLIFGDLGHIRCKLKHLSDDEVRGLMKKSCKKFISYMENNKCYGLSCNNVSGYKGGICFSKYTGVIYDNSKDFIDFLVREKKLKGYNMLIFNSLEAAEKAMEALKRPLLRFTFLREQYDIDMLARVYKYIPDIDWTKVDTDEDILIQCGCPKEKAIEYVSYCKSIIYELDNTKDVYKKVLHLK